MKKCPQHPIEIPEDREIVHTDDKEYAWSGDSKGYFLVRIQDGMLCCGFVNSEHKMVLELRGRDPEKMIKEIAARKLCSLENMGYIASELMIASQAMENGKKYIQR